MSLASPVSQMRYKALAGHLLPAIAINEAFDDLAGCRIIPGNVTCQFVLTQAAKFGIQYALACLYLHVADETDSM